jgi:hypothetical protein
VREETSAVTTYHVTPELAGFSGNRKVLRGLLMGGLWGATEITLNALGPSWLSSGNRLNDIPGVIISSVIFAFLSVAVLKRNLNYKVVVTDDSITAVHPMYKRSVRKSEVKTVAESEGSVWIAPSLRISKYGRFGTWFWGYVWIPKALPEYDSIRKLALIWQGFPKI